MQQIKLYLSFLIAIGLVLACRKTNNATQSIVALNVINASVVAPSVYVYFTQTASNFYLQESPVYYASSGEYSLPAGSSPLSVLSSSDTTTAIFQTNLSLAPGGIYSLYLSSGTGNQTGNQLIRDTIPTYADSSAGVRFINLSTDSGPINISLQGNNQNEFSSLVYEQITRFKTYPDNSNILNSGGYNYVVSDASGNVLANFNWIPRVFKNNTLVICGLDSLQTVQVFQVNNY